jgi:hypothetical protein
LSNKPRQGHCENDEPGQQRNGTRRKDVGSTFTNLYLEPPPWTRRTHNAERGATTTAASTTSTPEAPLSSSPAPPPSTQLQLRLVYKYPEVLIPILLDPELHFSILIKTVAAVERSRDCHLLSSFLRRQGPFGEPFGGLECEFLIAARNNSEMELGTPCWEARLDRRRWEVGERRGRNTGK